MYNRYCYYYYLLSYEYFLLGCCCSTAPSACQCLQVPLAPSLLVVPRGCVVVDYAVISTSLHDCHTCKTRKPDMSKKTVSYYCMLQQ
jgi:hypothetical protein